MKNFSPILLAFLFFACESKNQNAESSSGENQLENLEITIDTVKVDVGDELINASAFYGFGLSEDGQSAFFAEGQSVEVHEIDLAEMKWVQRIKFEKDGPNQAPGFINFFQVLPDGEFMLANYGIQAVYNSQAEKILDLKTTSEEYNGLDESVGSLYTFLHVSPDKKLAVSRPFEFESEEIALVEMDLENKSGKTLPLPNLEITKNFKVTFSQNGGATTMGDNVQIKPLRDRLVIYSGATADIYLYDWDTRELELVTFDHNLDPIKHRKI